MVLPSRLGRIGWLLLMSAPLPAQECWLTIAYNDEPIPPYIKRDVPSAGPQGESFALVDLAAHRLGCQIHWQRLPTLRVLHDVTLGEVDAALFYSWTPERGQTLRYPQRDGKLDPARRLARLNYVLYRKQGAAVSWNGEQLQPRHCRVATTPVGPSAHTWKSDNSTCTRGMAPSSCCGWYKRGDCVPIPPWKKPVTPPSPAGRGSSRSWLPPC